jgi:hypothetical protein
MNASGIFAPNFRSNSTVVSCPLSDSQTAKFRNVGDFAAEFSMVPHFAVTCNTLPIDQSFSVDAIAFDKQIGHIRIYCQLPDAISIDDPSGKRKANEAGRKAGQRAFSIIQCIKQNTTLNKGMDFYRWLTEQTKHMSEAEVQNTADVQKYLKIESFGDLVVIFDARQLGFSIHFYDKQLWKLVENDFPKMKKE